MCDWKSNNKKIWFTIEEFIETWNNILDECVKSFTAITKVSESDLGKTVSLQHC